MTSDVIEIIVRPWDTGSMEMYAAIWDDNMQKDPGELHIPNMDGKVEYIVSIDSMDHSYDIWFTDIKAGVSYYKNYPDSDSFSSYITDYTGSAELAPYTNPPSSEFSAEAIIYDYYIKINGMIIRPNNEFYRAEQFNDIYVYSNGYIQDNGITVTILKAGNPDPT